MIVTRRMPNASAMRPPSSDVEDLLTLSVAHSNNTYTRLMPNSLPRSRIKLSDARAKVNSTSTHK